MPYTCKFLKRGRSVDYCGEYADFILDTGFSGQPCCRKHLGSLVTVAMQADCGSLPTRPVTVVPAHQWDTYKEAR